MNERNEPLVLINLFAMPQDRVDTFVSSWADSIERVRSAKGFRGTRLHRSIDPDADHPVVNIARWDSVEDWQAAIEEFFMAPPGELPVGDAPSPVVPHPALYTVVHDTPDPRATA